MRKLYLLAILAMLTLVYSCADDIVLEQDPSVVGVYRGVYYYINDPGGTNPETLLWPVRWEFTDTRYFMDFDTLWDTVANPISNQTFCDCNGQYSFEEGVRLKEKGNSPPLGRTACAEELDPTGDISLIRKGSGKIDLKQQGNGYVKLIVLELYNETVPAK